MLVRIVLIRVIILQLVLINISDHFVRIRANGLGQADGRVYGCLLGQQTGRVVDISNSFELQVTDSMDGPSINEAFLTKKTEQCEHLPAPGPQNLFVLSFT